MLDPPYTLAYNNVQYIIDSAQKVHMNSLEKFVSNKTLNEEQLEGKTGASSRGNSSSNSVY